jgi:hypothetical protein
LDIFAFRNIKSGSEVMRSTRGIQSPYAHRRSVDRFLAAAIATAFFATCLGANAQENAGAVTSVTGQAFADRSTERRTLAPQAAILVGDRVGTGPASRVSLLLGRDTTLRLGERGSVVIDRFLMNAGGEISLESGPLMFDRPSGSPPEGVRIRSPYGLIAVRGTRFFVGPDGAALGIFVERGVVTVQAGGRTVRVSAGLGTTIPGPGAGPGEVKRWAPERITALFGSLR